jgi:hypothetical protein
MEATELKVMFHTTRRRGEVLGRVCGVHRAGRPAGDEVPGADRLAGVVRRRDQHHDLTDAGQSVAAPVDHVFCANATADGFAAEAVGSDSDWRA